MSSHDIDIDTHSGLLELAEEVVATPPAEDVRISNPEELIQRINTIQEPEERLKLFVKSVFDTSGTGTHEGFYVRHMFVFGLIGGWMFGGFYKSKDFHETFVRQNNAAFFESRHLAQRRGVDNYVYSVITKGAKYGFGTALLMSSSSFVCIASSSYRNRLYLPDWLVGLGTIGAISRCWLGMRGVVAGAALGSSAGLVTYGLLRGYEIITGETLMRRRFLAHQEWSMQQEARHNRLKREREKWEKQNPKF